MLGLRSDNEKRSFRDDERAIEGLPIRLVIALVVGVAALGIMMQVLGTFDFGADQEVEVDFDDGVVYTDDDSFSLTVVDDATGEPIPEATVMVRGDTLNLVQPVASETNDDGEVSFSFGEDINLDWRTTQKTGKVKFEIDPPTDSSYTDDVSNNKLTIIKGEDPGSS